MLSHYGCSNANRLSARVQCYGTCSSYRVLLQGPFSFPCHTPSVQVYHCSLLNGDESQSLSTSWDSLEPFISQVNSSSLHLCNQQEILMATSWHCTSGPLDKVCVQDETGLWELSSPGQSGRTLYHSINSQSNKICCKVMCFLNYGRSSAFLCSLLKSSASALHHCGGSFPKQTSGIPPVLHWFIQRTSTSHCHLESREPSVNCSPFQNILSKFWSIIYRKGCL